MMTRHTTMVVGPTGGGKSVVINTLAQSQTRYVIMCKSVVINTLAQSQTRYVMCNRQVEKIKYISIIYIELLPSCVIDSVYWLKKPAFY